jgi:hypothetical protein
MAPDYPAKSTSGKKKVRPKDEFVAAALALSKMPFPERSMDDEADQLHAEMLLFDSQIGEAIVTLLQGQHVPREDLRSDTELHSSLERLAETGNPTAATDARTYLAYLYELEHVLVLARERNKGKR